MSVRKTSLSSGGGGSITIGPPVSGLSIAGDELSLAFASASSPGAVSIAEQHLAGNKIFDASVGIGTTGSPGQALHIANGNALLDGASENAIIVKRTGVIGLRTDPIFSIGRIIAGGVNEPVFRWMYQDSVQAERQVLDIESTGTFANILDNTRRSMFESYRVANTVFPTFRLNDEPDMTLEMGAGGSRVAIGGMVRTGGNLVTVTTQTNHGFGTGQSVRMTPGEANFATGTFTVTVTGVKAFTYAQAGSNVSSTALAYVSADTDVYLRRNGYASLDVQLAGVSKAVVYTTSLTLQDGVALTSAMASGSNAVNLLNGARLNFSTADASAYLYRSAANTIRTPGAVTVDGAFSSNVASGSNAVSLLDGARLNLSTGDASAYLYRSAANTIRTPGALTVDSALSSNVASGSNAINLLDGARLNFSTGDASSYLSRTSANVVASAAGFTVNGLLTTNDVRPAANNALDIGTTGLRFRDHFYSRQMNLTSGDSSASPGNATINAPCGKSAIASTASACVITNSRVTTSSLIFITPLDNDTTLTSWKAVPTANTITVTGNAVAAATWKFQWLVVEAG